MRVSRGRCLLQDWLNLAGWSQSEYARRSGRSARMISYFCSGKRAMLPEDIHTAVLLLSPFGCTYDKLYEWTIDDDLE